MDYVTRMLGGSTTLAGHFLFSYFRNLTIKTMKAYKTWREDCAPIIAAVLVATKGLPEKEIKKALRDAYPYGERAMHPYKTWCDEIQKQRGLKKRKKKGGKKKYEQIVSDPSQLQIFENPAQ
jgi:hypothetical protein